MNWGRSQSPALLARSSGRFDAWALALFGFTLIVGVGYLIIGSRTTEITQNDGAYYYGVARHMALTGRFEEPIVWHFLHQPERIVHPPFDYWGCMTSLLLVVPLMVFGAVPETAFLTMSSISAAALVAFWYLVCLALPLRYRITQILAVVLFAGSPTMMEYRFQPESITVAQLFIILALIAFCRGRSVLAILSAFCILLTRADGAILFALVVSFILVGDLWSRDGRWRRLQTDAGAALACIGVYVSWSFVSFGTLAPPGAQGLPRLDDYRQVLHFGVTHTPSLNDTLERFDWDHLVPRFHLARLSLHGIPFTPLPYWWLLLAVVGGINLLRGRARESLIWMLCFVGFVGLVCVAGPGINFSRAPNVFTPLMILSGALGVDAILELRDAKIWRTQLAWAYIPVSVAVTALCAILVVKLPWPGVVPRVGEPTSQDVIQLDPIIVGEPVASNVPWYMIAYTRSPTVSIPSNGEAEIAHVLERYGVRWVVIFPSRPTWARQSSDTAMREVLSGRKSNLGRFSLERVPVSGTTAVFRVSGH